MIHELKTLLQYFVEQEIYEHWQSIKSKVEDIHNANITD